MPGSAIFRTCVFKYMSYFSRTVFADFSVTYPPLKVALAVPLVPLFLLVMAVDNEVNLALFRWLNALGRYTGDAVWANITLLGDGLLALALIGPVAARRPDIAWSMLLAALIGTLAVHGLKELFAEPRPLAVLAPSQIRVIGPPLYAMSFPSGHATTISVFASVMTLHVTDRRVQAGMLVAVILVALSRVVVGAHWPRDIAAGMVVGWFVALAAVWLAQHAPKGLTRQAQTAICALSLCAAWLFWDAPTGQDLALWLQRSLAVLAGIVGGYRLLQLWLPARQRGS
jgi:membrane-associated phospholipid phosphatase